MGRKCLVGGCRTGYKSSGQVVATDRIRVYSFPKDEKSLQDWLLRCLPNRIEKVTEYMGVYALHWPENVPMCRRWKYQVPAVPPSIFPNVPASYVPKSFASSSTTRSTKKALSETKVTSLDEMAEFVEKDRFKQESFF
ncbi:hypothetical protein PoB_005219300 [Plakobranchus ocellatus]|uniref:THAP-type domain-containing protein n=1 Tax=Plakobranchus ocellatus TaxID=259542 RepID=A0AAV4C1C3_9GAST|nr:hypothetical protein PoB_005219300 [Plakobranchus ocellatus]